MTPNDYKKLIGNRFFEVIFEKKDGTIRKMNARLKVRRYLAGGRPASPKVVPCWDRQALAENLKAGMARRQAGQKAYRCFLPESVISLKVGGKLYNNLGEEI